MKKLTMLLLFLILSLPSAAAAKKGGLEFDQAGFTQQYKTAVFDNGFQLEFLAPSTARRGKRIEGVILNLVNNSGEVLTIRWRESLLACGDLATMPFLPGMKYEDAGNPSATPDTILPPKKRQQLIVYFSNVNLSSSRVSGVNFPSGYSVANVHPPSGKINGISLEIPDSFDLIKVQERPDYYKFELTIKVIDSKGREKFCQAESYPMKN
ncbi:MAG: hypothetical protein LBP78_04930 [Acidaminococcales bacterium]|jgi:hypothetical protein|nr:hypothetical protein [Acidaminococcales bacterium]